MRIISTASHLYTSFSRESGKSLVVIQLDSHSDLTGGVKECKTYDGQNFQCGNHKITSFEYTRMFLHEANFNCPLVHLGDVAVIYHLSPYEELISAYGRIGDNGIIRSPIKTRAEDGYVGWSLEDGSIDMDIPPCFEYPLRESEFVKDLSNLSGSDQALLLNADLDAILLEDTCISERTIKSIRGRLRWTTNLLEQIQKPEEIIVARSPGYTPPERVDEIQNETLIALENIYC